MTPEKMSNDEIQGIVARAVEDAIDFIESEIEPKRTKAQNYFNGSVSFGAEDGRSKVVATVCRDSVRQVKPSLLRAFMATDKPVEYTPGNQDAVEGAAQATKAAAAKWEQKDGYRLLSGAFHDALVKKTGIIRAYWEDYSDVDVEDFSNASTDELAYALQQPGVELIEHSEQDGLHSGKLAITNEHGDLCFDAIPPEDFFVDDGATCLDDASVCGHRTEMRVGDLVKMGFDFNEVVDLGTDDNGGEADTARRGYHPEDDMPGDPSLKPVTVYEAYMSIDVEGTGIPKLYSFILAGPGKKLLAHEIADDIPYAVFEVDPEPHAFFGRSLVEILTEDQNAATSLLRGLLDNVHMTNTPRIAADKNSVNMGDVLNNEIGAIIRTEGAPGDKILPVMVPFSAGATLPALQYFNEVIESKTGVSRASLGLNPDALQMTTAAAVQATVAGAEGQIEVMARNLAETGMRRLFRLILRLMKKHLPPDGVARLDGDFVSIDPRSWSSEMDVTVNVGLGTNRKEERLIALRDTLEQQKAIWQAYGPGNGIVSLTNIRNTLADILKLSGVVNADRHYQPMSPEREAEMMQAAAQNQQPQQDPNASLAMAEVQKEQIRSDTKLKSDQMKAQQQTAIDAARLSLDAQEMNQDDDRKRDEMFQNMMLEIARLSGQPIDPRIIIAAQEAQRG